MTAYRVEYDSNNSGGDWWLTDEQWHQLEAAGWFVEWGGLDFCNETFGRIGRREGDKPSVAPDLHEPRKCPGHRRYESFADALASGERWLGALATQAKVDVEASDSDEAEQLARVRWEQTVAMDANEPGCSCCGQPHSFWARSTATATP